MAQVQRDAASRGAPPAWRRWSGRRSAPRRIGLLTLRGYMAFAIVIIAIKLVQVTS